MIASFTTSTSAVGLSALPQATLLQWCLFENPTGRGVYATTIGGSMPSQSRLWSPYSTSTPCSNRQRGAPFFQRSIWCWPITRSDYRSQVSGRPASSHRLKLDAHIAKLRAKVDSDRHSSSVLLGSLTAQAGPLCGVSSMLGEELARRQLRHR